MSKSIWNAFGILKLDKPLPTKEEIKEIRAQAAVDEDKRIMKENGVDIHA